MLQPVKSGAPPNPPATPAGPADATDATITDTLVASRPNQTPVPQPHGATRIACKPPHPRAVTRCFIRLANLWMAIDEHQSRDRDAFRAAAQLRDTFLRATTLTLALWPLTCQKPLQQTVTPTGLLALTRVAPLGPLIRVAPLGSPGTQVTPSGLLVRNTPSGLLSTFNTPSGLLRKRVTSSGLLVQVVSSGQLVTQVTSSGRLVKKKQTRIKHQARKTHQRSLLSNTLKRSVPIQYCLFATRSPCGTLPQRKSPRKNHGSQNPTEIFTPFLIPLQHDYLNQCQLNLSTTFHHVPERVPDTHQPQERPPQTRTETAASRIDYYTFSLKPSQNLPPNLQHRTTVYMDLLFSNSIVGKKLPSVPEGLPKIQKAPPPDHPSQSVHTNTPMTSFPEWTFSQKGMVPGLKESNANSLRAQARALFPSATTNNNNTPPQYYKYTSPALLHITVLTMAIWPLHTSPNHGTLDRFPQPRYKSSLSLGVKYLKDLNDSKWWPTRGQMMCAPRQCFYSNRLRASTWTWAWSNRYFRLLRLLLQPHQNLSYPPPPRECHPPSIDNCHTHKFKLNLWIFSKELSPRPPPYTTQTRHHIPQLPLNSTEGGHRRPRTHNTPPLQNKTYNLSSLTSTSGKPFNRLSSHPILIPLL